MFENLKNLGSLMAQAGQMREKAEQLKAELESKRVEGDAGGGAVRVTMNGRARVLRVEIEQALLTGIAGDDKAVAEELIAAAVNDANERVQQLVVEEVRKLTGGLEIPGLSGLLGPAQ